MNRPFSLVLQSQVPVFGRWVSSPLLFALALLFGAAASLRAEPDTTVYADDTSSEELSRKPFGFLFGGSDEEDFISGDYAYPAPPGGAIEQAAPSYSDFESQSLLRPGLVTAGSLLVPFERGQSLARGLRFSAETGVGYDSNPLVNNRSDAGGTVFWTRLNAGYSSGAGQDGSRFFWGFDIGGDLFAYDSGFARGGRDPFQPMISPYFGFRGAKTTVRMSTFYQRTGGNFLYGYDILREVPVAEADNYGYGLAVTREIGRGNLNYVYDFRRVDFASGTLLNDQDSHIHDLSYLYDHPSMPKTSFGLGFRFGDFYTDRNPDMSFYEPSLRINYAATAKTSLNGRIGYAFQSYEGPAVLGNDGQMTYALGANWNPTERLRFGILGYRDFNPSFVTAGQTFATDGFTLTGNYSSPWWLLNFQGYIGYESADYLPTVAGPALNRQDDFFRCGVSVGRPIRLVRWLDTNVSLFYDYTENQSSDRQATFDRHFTGLRVTSSL